MASLRASLHLPCGMCTLRCWRNMLAADALTRATLSSERHSHCRLDWSGAPLLSSVNAEHKGMMPPLSSLTKKTKGRKRAGDKVAPLEHIMGYTAERDDDEDDDADDDVDDGSGDGVVERDAIKRMAAKMEARAAKARAEAAHAGQ